VAPPRAERRSIPPPAETEAQLRQITASRIGNTIFALLAVVPIGFLCVWFAGAPWVRVMGAISITLIAVGLVGLRHYATQTPSPQSQARYHGIALVMAFAAPPLAYALGEYSGVATMLGMFVLLYAMSAPPKYALRLTVAIGVPHVIVHALLMMRLIPDYGVLTVDGGDVERGLSVLGLTSIYVLALTAGQATRRRTEETLTELRRVAQQVALREAMLREARLALQEAGGVGQTGRFTDQQFGHFTIGAILGRGGMGEIYEAEDVRTGSPAAIKLLRPPKADDDKVWERFAREAEIVASLSSPHVVRVLEVGEEGSLPFIAMERLWGKDLAQLLREQPTLDPRLVAQMVVHCAEGLAAAHARAIVHRDVKPHNLFLCDDGVWKVLDFGVARLFDGSQTMTKNLVGTPGYMAPEQLGAEGAADHRTDIHALAVVTYRALTGHPAFSGSSLASVLLGVACELPIRPTSLVRVYPAVSDVLRVALAKDPDDRFDDVRVFASCVARAILHGTIDPEVQRRAAELDAYLTWSSEV
jgi:serine/threonine-protein kinase